jgi:hypothetical protein
MAIQSASPICPIDKFSYIYSFQTHNKYNVKTSGLDVREYRNLVNQRTKVLIQMDRVLVMCGIRLSSCICSIDSKRFIQITEALIGGETEPDKLAPLVYGNRKTRSIG